MKEGKEPESSRSVSVMSSLSYRKRSNLKDSIGGAGDESSLFSTLKDQSDTMDRSSLRKAKSKSADGQDDTMSVSSWKKSGDDMDDRGSVISQAYSEATSHARKGLDRRWTSRSSPEFDKESSVSSSRMSARRRMGQDDSDDDDVKSSVSSYGVRRSASWRDDSRSDSYMSSLSPSLSRRGGGGGGTRSPGSVSGISVARSSRLSEFGLRLDDDDDSMSVAYSEGGASVRSLGRSLSTPARPHSSEDAATAGDASEVKTVSHRNYLDPDLEKAINEVLSFKPIKFKRRSLQDSDGDEDEEEVGGGGAAEEGGERKSGRTELESSVRRSASGSALDYGRSSSSLSSRSSSSRHKAKKKSRASESESSSEDDHHHRRSRGKGKKSSRKSSRKKKSESESSESESSESSSSSGSTVSYRSSSSVKKGPGGTPERPPSKKDEKKNKKKVDSLVMKYRYKPDSD